MSKQTLFLLSISFFLITCIKDVENKPLEEEFVEVELNLPEEHYNYADAYDLPEHIDNDPLLSLFSIFEPSANPLTNEGATLGRVLFYDKKLSINNEVSCASCHLQEFAFTDPRVKSIGAHDEETSRNSMGFQNLMFNNRMFWDHRVVGLENQVSEPIENPIEMDMMMGDLAEKLNGIDYYKPLFDDAFGSELISSENISFALAQFIRSISTFNSKYDQGVINNFANFTVQEIAGKDLFFGGTIKCNHCHSTQNFYSRTAMNNGLDSEYADQGQFLATGNESDKGEFKVPSLRNVELTGPYMHDGRFETLEEVVEHYSSGVQSHPNLNDRITVETTTGGTPFHSNMTDDEKAELVAFLKTLTDQEMITNNRFSDPF